jgi:hypothetical protein
MLRQIPPVALLILSALAPLGAHSADKLVLKSVSVDLPFDTSMFPAGPGSDAARNNCLACHSAAMVLNQPALSKTQWRAEVEKMRASYKAPIDPKDVDTIVDYLAGIRAAD